MLPDDVVELTNLTKYGSTYIWDFGDNTTSTEKHPVHLYTQVGIYDISLDVWTEHGCTGRLVKPEAVTVSGEGDIEFPNAFAPHLDGSQGGGYNLNNLEPFVFHPVWEGVKDYELIIYDRWGVEVFYSDKIEVGWDGYYKEELCDQGVYFWKCNGNFNNGQIFDLEDRRGDVTLLHIDFSK